MSGTLKEIIFNPSASKMDTINILLEEGVTTVNEVVKWIIYSQNVEGMFLVAKYVNIGKNAIGRLAHEVSKSGNAEFIYRFAKEIEEAPINELTKGIIATKKNNYICKFAVDIDKADVQRLGMAIIALHDAYYIMLFLRKVKLISKDMKSRLIQEIINLKEAIYIYECATEISDAPIEDLANALIETTEPREIFYFLRDFKNRLKDTIVIRLLKRIVELKDSQWIYLASTLELPFNEEFGVKDLAMGLVDANQKSVLYSLNIVLYARDYANKEAPISELVLALVNVQDYDSIVKIIIECPQLEANSIIDFLMVSMPRDSVIPYLMTLAKENQYYSYYAVEKLIEIGDVKALSVLVSLLRDDNMQLTSMLIRAVAEIEATRNQEGFLAV